MNTLIYMPFELRRKIARDTIVGGAVKTRDVRYTRFMLTHTHPRWLHLWSRPYFPTKRPHRRHPEEVPL